MWFFNKKDYSDIFQYFDECDIKFRSNYTIELMGMFYEGKLHGYGCLTDDNKQAFAFGIFKNGELYKNFGRVFQRIQKKIGRNSKMVSSRVWGCGTYIGELMSPAGYNENPKLRRDRYGILILKEGMYVGTFPPGFFMTWCVGHFYNLKGKKTAGTFDIKIEDNRRWGNDLLGEYCPSY